MRKKNLEKVKYIAEQYWRLWVSKSINFTWPWHAKLDPLTGISSVGIEFPLSTIAGDGETTKWTEYNNIRIYVFFFRSNSSQRDDHSSPFFINSTIGLLHVRIDSFKGAFDRFFFCQIFWQISSSNSSKFTFSTTKGIMFDTLSNFWACLWLRATEGIMITQNLFNNDKLNTCIARTDLMNWMSAFSKKGFSYHSNTAIVIWP